MPTYLYITEPSANEAAYEKDALLYEIANQYAIGSVANNGGLLQVDIGATGAAEASDAGFVYLSILDNQDNIETSVAVVTATTGGGLVTVNVPYSASYPTSGNVRIVSDVAFSIETGYTGETAQPIKTYGLNLRADLNGLYRITANQAAIGRFNFLSDPDINAGFANNTKVSVYPNTVGSKTPVNAFKHTEGTTPQLTIAYKGCRQLISSIVSGKYVVALESVFTQTINQDAVLAMTGYEGKSYTINFQTSITDADTTITPTPAGSWYSLITQDSGQTITGVVITPEAAGDYQLEFVFDDGGSAFDYTITLTATASLSVRTCCNGRLFLFWHPKGGWVYYEFNLQSVTSVNGGSPTFTQSDDLIRSINYSNQQEVVSLIAPPESETIFDYLNQIFLTMQIFEVVSTTYTQYNLTNGQSNDKNLKPFLSTSNRFSIDLIKSKILTRINEGK
jgi:hypothetical protein